MMQEIISKKMTASESDIKHGKEFLKAVKKALKHAKAISRTVNDWGENYEAPPLLRQTANWEVDDEAFESFECLVDFMREALFGVDCDNDSAVLFACVNRKKHENFLPACRVPSLDWDHPDLLKRQRQLELAQLVVRSAQSRLQPMEESFQRDLARYLRRQERLARAKNCVTCKGKGWVATDYETWKALDYSAQCRTQEIGCILRPKNEKPRSSDKFRLFCECQKDGA